MAHRPIRLLFAFAFIFMCFGLGLIFDGEIVKGLAFFVPGAAAVAVMVTTFFRNSGGALTDWQTSPLPGQVPTDQDRLGGRLAVAFSLLPLAAAGAMLYGAWTHGPDGTGARVIVMLFVLVFAGVPAVLGLGLLKAALMWYYGNPMGRLGVRRLSWFIAVPAALVVLGGLTDEDHSSLAWSLPLLVVTAALMYLARTTEADRVAAQAAAQEQAAAVDEVLKQMAAQQDRKDQQQG